MRHESSDPDGSSPEMALLDSFAREAMSALIARETEDLEDYAKVERIAFRAYSIAIAMVGERKKAKRVL